MDQRKAAPERPALFEVTGGPGADLEERSRTSKRNRRTKSASLSLISVRLRYRSTNRTLRGSLRSSPVTASEVVLAVEDAREGGQLLGGQLFERPTLALQALLESQGDFVEFREIR